VAELAPGDEVAYTVTWLEMTRRPAAAHPPSPAGAPLLLIHAEAPPPWYFLALYDAVGSAYEWTDWHRRPAAELADFIGDPRVELFTLLRGGWPAGFFVLDTRAPGLCDLAYFGLVPEATGRGLGRWLLAAAVHMGWSRPGVERMTVNTNSLDHPAALPLYQKAGFVPYDRTHHRRVLSRPRRIAD
jgi:GNAT superfamily N-acetyltransferase